MEKLKVLWCMMLGLPRYANNMVFKNYGRLIAILAGFPPSRLTTRWLIGGKILEIFSA